MQGDPRCPPQQLKAWAAHAGPAAGAVSSGPNAEHRAADFSVIWFDYVLPPAHTAASSPAGAAGTPAGASAGSPHRYVLDCPRALVQFLLHDIASLLARESGGGASCCSGDGGDGGADGRRRSSSG